MTRRPSIKTREYVSGGRERKCKEENLRYLVRDARKQNIP